MRRVLLLVLVAISCGGPPTPVSAPSAPAVAATAAPAPATRTGCGITGPGPGNGLDCPRENPSYLQEVDAAINRVIRDHPEYFDFNDTSGREEYLVLRPAPFVLKVIEDLESVGLCAAVDTKELQVKRTNAFNDQYQIILSSGHLRRGNPSYRATCSPAAFPTPTGIVPPPEGCALPSSREILCARDGEDPAFLGDVERAIDALRAEQPALFDGDRVKDPALYYRGVARLLSTGGRCAHFDGEEIAVKSSNAFSEQYHVLLSSGLVRKGPGAFRAKCYPAAF